MTPAERILWTHLRNRRFAGFKFRRQQPIDHYIADFFCPSARVAIELDGDSHMGKDERDIARQAYIESHEIRVVRFWNTEVYGELEWDIDSIGWVQADQMGSRPQRALPFRERVAVLRRRVRGETLPPTPTPLPPGERGA